MNREFKTVLTVILVLLAIAVLLEICFPLAAQAKTLSDQADPPVKNMQLIGTFTITTYADTPADQEQYVGQTASGAAPTVGRTVAAPKWMQMGIWIYIEGIGVRRVEDRGAALNTWDSKKGWKIDLLVDESGETYENRKVWIIEGGYEK